MMTANWKRRASLIIALVASASLVSCSANSSAQEGEDGAEYGTEPVVVASWGGSFDEALQEAYFNDFTEETGVEVMLAPADYPRFIAMNEQKASEWNAIDTAGGQVYEWAEDGVLLEMPGEVEPSDLVSDGFSSYLPGAYLTSFVMVYRTDAFDTPPTSWADFWDVEKFPGKRAAVATHDALVDSVLLADGVAPEDLYPLDFDRGLDLLTDLQPNLSLTGSYAELRQSIETGQVDLALMPSGSAAHSAIESDGTIEIVWTDNLMGSGGFPFSTYGPNEPAALKLMEYMQDPKRQAEFTNISYYGSASSAAEKFIDPKLLPYMSTYSENYDQAILIDEAGSMEFQDEYIDRFSEWLAG